MSNFSTLDLVDRERLSRSLMTLVGKDYEVHQRGQERFELVVLLLAEAGREQGFDAAGDARGRQGRAGTASGEQLSRLRVEAFGKVVEQLDTTPNRSDAGGAGLDDHRPRLIGFVAGAAQHRLEPQPHPVPPDSPTAACGCSHSRSQALGAGVEGGEEAVFFVGEMLVEGGSGDAGPVDHVLDVGFQVAEVGCSVEHRYDQTLPLDRANQVRWEFAHSGGELAAAVGKQFERNLDLLGRPVTTNRSEEGLLAQLDSIERHRETHKFRLKTMQVFSRYQNIGKLRTPSNPAQIYRSGEERTG